MIRQATETDGPLILRRARAAIAVGPRVEVDWLMHLDNPALPYQFFILDEEAVAEYNGWVLVVCGPVQNPQELLAFVHMQNCKCITTDSWRPAGWTDNPLQVMEWQGRPAMLGPPIIPQGLDTAPSMEEALAVLESSEPIVPRPVRDGMYAAMCSRLARGYAVLYGIRRPGGTQAAVAALGSLTPAEGYLTYVETRPADRHHGHATALVRLLCERYALDETGARRRISLVCTDEMTGFYQSLGFVIAATGIVDVRHPDLAQCASDIQPEG